MATKSDVWGVNLSPRPVIAAELTEYMSRRDLRRSDVLNAALNLFLEQVVRPHREASA